MSTATGQRWTVLVAVGLTLAATSVAAFLVVWTMHRRVAEQAAFESLRGAARTYGQFERSDMEKLTAALPALLSDDDLQREFLARDREALLRRTAPVLEQMRLSGVTHWYFVTPERTVFLRVHEPDIHGDLVERVTMQRAARTGQISAGKELGVTAFALRVVSPWRDASGRLIGYMELGEEIDHFLTRMKQGTGNDIGLVIKKEFLDEKAWVGVLGGARNTWNDRPDVVLVDTTSYAQGIADFTGRIDDIPHDGLLLEERLDGDRAWLRGVFPVQDVGGRRVGALYLLHDFTQEHRAFAAGRTRGIFIVLAIVAVGLGIVWSLLRRLDPVRGAASRHGLPSADVAQSVAGDASGEAAIRSKRM